MKKKIILISIFLVIILFFLLIIKRKSYDKEGLLFEDILQIERDDITSLTLHQIQHHQNPIVIEDTNEINNILSIINHDVYFWRKSSFRVGWDWALEVFTKDDKSVRITFHKKFAKFTKGNTEYDYLFKEEISLNLLEDMFKK